MSPPKSPTQSQEMTLHVTSNATKSYPKGKWPSITTQMARKRSQSRWSLSKKRALRRVNHICYQTRREAIRTQTQTLNRRRKPVCTELAIKSPQPTNQMSLLPIINSKASSLINRAPRHKVETLKIRHIMKKI